MLREEAIYCMKAYLPDTDSYVSCKECQYYKSKMENGIYFCNSSEAHKMAIKSLEAYEEIMSHAEDEHSELIEVLQEIRKAVWDVDIPSPTVPEYIEHHKQIQGILALIDSKIKEVSE